MLQKIWHPQLQRAAKGLASSFFSGAKTLIPVVQAANA
jgi:hypothetical protein